MYNYFKNHPLVKEKKPFKGFFLFLALVAILFNGAERFGLNVFISILLQHVSHITTCKFLGLERKHIAYLVLLLAERFEQFWLRVTQGTFQ